MEVIHRKADKKARVTLPASFAGSFLTIEQVSENEVRILRSRVVTIDDELERMVSQITSDNLHSEADYGPSVGEEQI